MARVIVRGFTEPARVDGEVSESPDSRAGEGFGEDSDTTAVYVPQGP